ncbi:MAG: M20/M25/M40 family metallo-hydrolase, partial [Bryobacteraceae bacterium]
MDSLLAYARDHQRQIAALIKLMVECESPSDDPRALDRFAALLCDVVAPMADIRTWRQGHVRCTFRLPGKSRRGQVLVLGHSDTVWPMGTLDSMPFREKGGRLWGPGVLDMKSGLAFFVFAMRALRDLEIPVSRRVVLQINADEEVGSATSRALTEEAARKSDMVLVLEPGTGLEGKLKTARKGVGSYTVKVRGKASHAGVDFAAGASAIVELARQIDRIARFSDPARGVTVNPGVIGGGTRSNVIAAEASAEVDIRLPRLRDERALDRKFRALRPIDKRCTMELSGGMNRPPLERSAGVRRLFAKASKLAAELSVALEESATG